MTVDPGPARLANVAPGLGSTGAAPKRVLILVSLVCLMVIGLQVYREWVARNVQLRDTSTSLINLATSLTQHAEDAVRLADTSLVGVVQRLEAGGEMTPIAVRWMRLRVFSEVPGVHGFVVYGADGSRVASSGAMDLGNAANLDFFRHHRDTADRGAFIGPLIQIDGNQARGITVSRRLQNADGSFAGVVAAMINETYFVEHYARYDLGPSSSISLLSTTGMLLARSPPDERFVGANLSSAPIFRRHLQGAGSYITFALTDGVKRVSGYCRSDLYPFTAVAAMAEDHALLDWRADALTHALIVVILTGIVGLLGLYLARQITSRYAIEVSLRESEARNRLLAESTTDAVICLDLELRRTYASPACEALFGYTTADLLATMPATNVHPDDVGDALRRLQFLAAGKGDRAQNTSRVRHVQGHWIWLEVDLALVRDDATGAPVAITCSIRDISERKAQADKLSSANKELERMTRHLARARDQAEKASRAKTRFLASMSHELRTPLNGVLGYAQLLHLEGGLTVSQANRVSAMVGAGTHLLDMINRVLDFSETETGIIGLDTAEIELRNVTDLCLDLVRPAAVAKALALGFVTGPDVPRTINADPTRLRQILLNLLGNAVKFTQEGKVELRLRLTDDGAGLRLEVVDSGPGIKAEHRHRLFRDFDRLESTAFAETIEGAGLGLAISARLTSALGGRLSFEPNPEGGSMFCLELPLAPHTNSATSFIAATGIDVDDALVDGPSRRLRVLVVDDVAMNCDIASAFLSAAGHQVTCADGGVAAVAAATAADYDVILMDVRMPDVDGLEATRRIRALSGSRGQVPIVALTAQAFAEQVRECHEAGMDAHLAKPFSPEALLSSVLRAADTCHVDHEAAAAGLALLPPAGAAGQDRSSGTAALVGAAAAEFGMDLPVFDLQSFTSTTGFLEPDMVASYLQTLVERSHALLGMLAQPMPPFGDENGLAASVHTLAGSAGMFGFERLSTTARAFERAVLAEAAETAGLAAGLVAVIEASIEEMRRLIGDAACEFVQVGSG